MIVGETAAVLAEASTRKPTLDDLFRRAALREPHAVALVDDTRSLTYAQADRAIWAIAAKMRGLGLPTDAVIATQLGNCTESVITLLGILRAGMIAVLLPQLWRETEIVAALGGGGARALITQAYIGDTNHCDVVMAAAAQLFSVRQVCAFGGGLPDGVVPLDDVMTAASGALVSEGHADNPATHAAVMTFEPTPRGITPMLRNHTQLIAGADVIVREAGLNSGSALLCATPSSSFGGLCAGVMSWLICGGKLVLHQPFDAEAFVALQYAHQCNAVVLPGAALDIAAGLEPALVTSVIALWRAPELAEAAAPWTGNTFLTDVRCFGEFGLAAMARTYGETITPLTSGPAFKRLANGNLALQGAAAATSNRADAGFLDTRYPCREENGRLIVSGPQPGMVGIGGYRIARADIDSNAAALAPFGIITALPDALTGQRLKGGAGNPAASEAILAKRGVNPLIAGAFGVRPLSEHVVDEALIALR
jgi:acyl-coenzyme A synthetase/AMP-(fatty) acid ligase